MVRRSFQLLFGLALNKQSSLKGNKGKRTLNAQTPRNSKDQFQLISPRLPRRLGVSAFLFHSQYKRRTLATNTTALYPSYMLSRRTKSDLVWYESPLLAAAAIPHAFTTRIGGVSSAPFDTLNFGNPANTIQDPQSNIDENYRRLQQAIGVEGRSILRVHQVHGCTVAVADPDREFNIHAYADAVVITGRDQLASVRIADCVPVLLADEQGRGVAAVHAGWRGVVAGVVPRALEKLRAISPDSNFIAAIGPCIGFDAFEVGPEVLDAFHNLLGDKAPIRRAPNGKGHVDLRAAIATQLHLAGILKDKIDSTDRCTFTHADEFFSHRRDNGVTGRMVALVGLPR
jgi:YfiH family protein